GRRCHAATGRGLGLACSRSRIDPQANAAEAYSAVAIRSPARSSRGSADRPQRHARRLPKEIAMLQRLIFAVVVLSAVPARADDKLEQAKQEVKAADIDYRLGRFSEALAGYTRAYQLYPVPALLFNIGQ